MKTQWLPNLMGLLIRLEGRKLLRLHAADQSALSNNRGSNIAGPVLLYIHIPFCRSLCPYCSFNRYPYAVDEAGRYFSALKTELDLYLRHGFNFSAVYIGGGTPTLDMDQLSALVAGLKQTCDIREISVETTPGELTPETVDRLGALGVNRLSVGVQSFNADVVKSMGRKNPSPEDTMRRLRMTLGRFDTVNVDFMFNIPEQTIDQFADDIAMIKALKLDQVTFYPLMPSPHRKQALERRFGAIDTSREKRFYDLMLNSLWHDGYDASTPWCFSRGNHMIDEYIVRHHNYIGIGAGSVSMLPGGFHVNTFDLHRYQALLGSGRLPIVGLRRFSSRDKLRYHLLVGLFGLRLTLRRERQSRSADIRRHLMPELTALKAFGLLREGENDTLHVTEKGMYAVSVMMREFFTALNGLREYHIKHRI